MCKTLLTLLTLISFTACTTMQAIPDVQPASVKQNVQVGDQVRLQVRDGATYELKVDQISDDSLYGVIANGKRYRFPMDSIVSLEKQVTTGSSKVWTVLGIVAVIGIIAALAGGGGGDSGGGGGY